MYKIGYFEKKMLLYESRNIRVVSANLKSMQCYSLRKDKLGYIHAILLIK